MADRLLFVSSVLSGLLVIAGCSRGTPAANATSTAPAQSQAASPNLQITDAVALANVHLDHREFQDAERVLTKAIEQAAGATNKAEAIALLSKVKAAAKVSAAPTLQPVAANSVASVAEPRLSVASDNVSAPLQATDALPTEPAKPPATTQAVTTEEKPEVIEVATEQPDQQIEETPATDVEVRRVLKEADGKESADEAVKLLEQFDRRHALSKDQDKDFQQELAMWKDRAEKGLVKNGREWIPAGEYKQAIDEADTLVEQAFELIRLGNAQNSIQLLEKASRLDRNGIRADFVLGMIYATVGAAGWDKAEHHLQEVLRRQPNHISAMNNLAVTLVKKRDFDQALRHWKRAIELAPKTPAVSQNLGRVVTAASSRKLPMTSAQLRRFSDTYSELTALGKGPQADPHTGWLFMPLYLAEAEQARHHADGVARLVDIASGSGFVFGDGYVLTNRHVVRDEAFGDHDAYAVIAPGDVEKEYDAKLLAVSTDDDLAILHCPDLDLPAVPLETELLSRGSEILILGYPEPGVVGIGLKATQGIVTALPEASTDGMLLFDATANHGNSGGPVLTRRGAVGAVLRAAILTEQEYSAGIPSTKAIEFIQKILPDWKPVPLADARLDWADVDSKVGPSTIRILCRRQEVNVAVGGNEKVADNYLEDRSCCICGGASRVFCPAKACSNGLVSVPRREQVGYSELTGPIIGTRYYKEKCSQCSGKGAVDCPYCSSGIDPEVR